MEFRELFLCLAVSILTSTLLFFYVKNRMFKTEQKVDLMFQLIQEHERSAQLRHRQRPFVAPHGPMPTPDAQKGPDLKPTSNLIQISDDEDSVFSGGSSEESDSESETEGDSQLKISKDDLATNIKTISLSLSGAETNKQELNLEDMGDLNEVGGLEDSEIEEDKPKLTPDGPQEPVDMDITDTTVTSIDYNKMNMKTLKAEAASRGLSNYKGLRKPKLVELLQESSS